MYCGSLTTGTTNELVLAFAGYAVGVGGAGTNFTAIHDEAGGLGEYHRAASAGTVAPTETTEAGSEAYGMISVAFKHN
jgi:hypothetical protein